MSIALSFPLARAFEVAFIVAATATTAAAAAPARATAVIAAPLALFLS